MITRPERSPFRKITRVSCNFGVWNVHRQRGYPLPIFIDFVIIPRLDVILVVVNVSWKRQKNMAFFRGIMISGESKKSPNQLLFFPFFAEENCRTAAEFARRRSRCSKKCYISGGTHSRWCEWHRSNIEICCVDATSAAKALQSSQRIFMSFGIDGTSAAEAVSHLILLYQIPNFCHRRKSILVGDFETWAALPEPFWRNWSKSFSFFDKRNSLVFEERAQSKALSAVAILLSNHVLEWTNCLIFSKNIDSHQWKQSQILTSAVVIW